MSVPRLPSAQRRALRCVTGSALAIAVLVSIAPGSLATGAPTLSFSAIPDQDETRLREKFEPVAAYLSAALAVPVEYVHATQYADAVELFKNGDIQLAWFGGLTGVQARHAVPGARAIAQGEEDPEYFSYFIAHRDAGISRADDFPHAIAGKRFAFGSRGSTSGRLMPEAFIRKYTGKAPEEFLGAIVFSGSHDRTVELVQTGQVDVGVLNYKVYDRRVDEGQTDADVARIIWKSPTYADYNFTAHPILEERYGAGFIDRLQAALLAMKDPNLLGAFPRKSLIAAENRDYAAIEQTARELGFIR